MSARSRSSRPGAGCLHCLSALSASPGSPASRYSSSGANTEPCFQAYRPIEGDGGGSFTGHGPCSPGQSRWRLATLLRFISPAGLRESHRRSRSGVQRSSPAWERTSPPGDIGKCLHVRRRCAKACLQTSPPSWTSASCSVPCVAAGLAGKFKPGWKVPPRSLIAAVLGGLLLGYGARLAYGCNIGAYFSGIASSSLHGWLWLPLPPPRGAARVG